MHNLPFPLVCCSAAQTTFSSCAWFWRRSLPSPAPTCSAATRLSDAVTVYPPLLMIQYIHFLAFLHLCEPQEQEEKPDFGSLLKGTAAMLRAHHCPRCSLMSPGHRHQSMLPELGRKRLGDVSRTTVRARATDVASTSEHPACVGKRLTASSVSQTDLRIPVPV